MTLELEDIRDDFKGNYPNQEGVLHLGPLFL
jgi:hypothetical protein